jgi:hypothetical protein
MEGDLTNLLAVKQWLPIPASTVTDDALLAGLITSTSNDFLRATRRPDLLAATYAEVRQGDGASRLAMYHWPINSIASLTVASAAVQASADRVAAGYYVDEDIDPERAWTLYLAGSVFTDGAVIQIGYNAGYTTAPGDIVQAVIDWVVYRYKGRPNVTTTRRSQEGGSVQVEQIDVPPNVKDVIARYERKVPGVDRRAEEATKAQRGFNFNFNQ